MIRFTLKFSDHATDLNPSKKAIGILHVEMKFDAGLRIRRSLQMKVVMDDWIRERQRIKPQAQGAMEVNMVLNQIEAKFQELNHRVRYTGEQLNIQLVEDEILHAFKNGGIRSKQKQKKPLEFFNDYIESCRHRLSASSIKAYQSAIKHLLGYSEVHRAPITWDLFDRDFGEAFIQYLTSRNISNNTVGKYVMSLKILLKQAMLKRLLHTEFFRDYRVDKAPVEFVYLTSEELDAIMDLELSHVPNLERARDVLVFQCGCGLRYGDILNITWANIQGDQIEIATSKTRKYVRIPLNRYTRFVVEKNEGLEKPIFPYANQVQNRLIKQLGEMIGMHQQKVKTKFVGNRQYQTLKSKFEMLTTHTARRTFITLALEKGMRPEVVMRITGHTKLSTLQRYISITDNVLEREMRDAFG